MANYIKEEILCEAYTHLNTDIKDDPKALEDLKRTLTSFIEDRAKFLLGEDVRIQVEFEDGSLKTRLQVIGSAGLILMKTVNPVVALAAGVPTAVIAYPHFRDGIEQLASDAAALAQSANLEVIFKTKTVYCDRVTIEKRRGVFGRVSELLSQLEGLKALANLEDLPTTENKLKDSLYAVEKLTEWGAKTDKLFDKIQSSITQECIAGGLLESVNTMPKQFSWVKLLKNEDFSTKLLKSDTRLYGETESVAAQYKATLESIRQKLESRKSAAHKINQDPIKQIQ